MFVIEFRQLKYFLQIAQDQNYSIAAKKLYITQPTLSWTIKQLEEELCTKLFIPNGKKLILTAEGEELFHHAKHLLAEHQKVLELFQNREDMLTGHIHIGVPALFGICFFMNIIMDFMEKFPKVKITMHNGGSIEIQKAVEAGTVELGIVSYISPSNTLDSIEFSNITYPIALVVSNQHHLANKKSVSITDLKNESFILLTENYTIGVLPVQLCMNAGFTPNVVLRSSEWDVICEAVANSNNVSILPYPFLKKAQNKNLKIISIDAPEATIPIALISKKNSPQSSPLHKFSQFMLDNILNNPNV